MAVRVCDWRALLLAHWLVHRRALGCLTWWLTEFDVWLFMMLAFMIPAQAFLERGQAFAGTELPEH